MKNRSLVALSLQTLLWLTSSLVAANVDPQTLPPAPKLINIKQDEEIKDFKLNFQNISILEFMKFVSKVAKINFIYDPNDLNFAITIVADQPTTLENVLGAFTQILKINGLNLIEDDNSYIINRNPNIKQIPTIVSDDVPFNGEGFPAYITRIYRLSNVDPGKVAQLIRPMISPTALVDIFPTSRLMIVTDITSNINQISKLLAILDQPKANLQFSNYSAKNGNVINLKMLAEQIIPPLLGDAPFLLVTQPSSNLLYIVSTPYGATLATSILTEIESSALIEGGRALTGKNIYIYPLKFRSADFIENSLKNIGANAASLGFASQGLFETIANVKYLKTTNSLLFIGPEEAIDRIGSLLAQIDIPGKPANANEHAHFFMFRPSYLSPDEVKRLLNEVATNMDASGLSDQALIATILNARVIEGTRSILFTGDSASIEEIKALADQMDKDTNQFGISSSYYIYKVKNTTMSNLQTSLDGLVDNLQMSRFPDDALIQSIHSLRYIEQTNSIIFTGNQKSISQLQNILPTFDTDGHGMGGDFFMYTPKYVLPDQLLSSINDVVQRLMQSPTSDPSLIQTLQSAKYITQSNTIIFTGTPPSLDRAKELLATLDQGRQFIKSEDQVFIYSPKHISSTTIQSALSTFASSLSDGDPTKQTIENGKWIETSHTFVFQGPPTAIQKIEQFLDATDATGTVRTDKNFFVYKLKYISGDVVIKDLKQMVQTLQVTTQEQDALSALVDNIEWIKSTNSLFISGPANEVAQIKTLIAEFDTPSDLNSTKGPDLNSSFLMYKPLHLSAKEIEDNLRGLATDLEESGLSDASLINTINSVRVSQTTGSLVFTGTQSNLDRIKGLLITIDSVNPNASVQQVGMTTFLIYKIKFASYDYLLSNLRSLSNDLDASKGGDKDLVRAIEGMRYIKDTNSIVFTGSAATLEKIKTIVDKFDIASGPPPAPKIAGTYILYKPKYMGGPELITILRDFEQNLQSTGIDQQNLFDCISHLKWMDKTGNILISGEDAQIQAVKELLERFDVPQKGAVKTHIETFDDMTFLTYKLQYHQGDEIQVALKQISTDLHKVKDSPQNTKLVEAIQSLQWIKMTNSLITSGDARTLEKLREFLTSIDRPLQQVYIEVLILQTTIGDNIEFGLQWASQGNYKNRFGYSTGSFPATPFDNGVFQTDMSKVNASTPPNGATIPSLTGGTLGVIGNIILHKGQSYFALGSLVNALQQYSDTTAVINQKVVVQDNTNAQLFVGSNIPFSGSTVQIVGQTQTTSSNLEYRDVGASLSITPYIGDNNIITMDIDLELSTTQNQNTGSDSGSNTTVTNNNLGALTTSKTTIQTRLQVPDECFAALTGMIQDTSTHNRVGIPCLGGLPIVGALFSDNLTNIQNGSIIMFLKPTIIRTNDIYKEITNRQEDLFREQANAEYYDKGINLVSTPDDK